jgi:hypothetical protein
MNERMTKYKTPPHKMNNDMEPLGTMTIGDHIAFVGESDMSSLFFQNIRISFTKKKI